MIAEGQIMLRRPEGAENIQLALDEFELLQDEAPDSQAFKVQLGLGTAHARLGGLFQNRADLIEAQSSLRPPGGPEQQALQTARTKASQHRETAKAQFLKVLGTEDNPAAQESIPALIELARLAVLDHRLEAARSYAGRYLDQVRKSKELWAETTRRYPEDRPLWDAKLASAVVKEVEARDLLGNIYYKMGLYEEALDQLNHVVLLSPERGDAYLNRAIIYEDLGRKRDAVEDLRQFMVRAAEIEMDPGDPRAIEATKRLMRLERELGMEPTIPTVVSDEKGEGT
jgi:tetratricopeptide (TPR) repeat protein